MFRPEYDEVVAYHPYRTYQPWDHGGIRLFQVDGVNGFKDDAELIRAKIGQVEQDLLWEGTAAGLPAHQDNHYGFTVRIDGRDGQPTRYLQYRFSDGSLYVWLMPGIPEEGLR